MKDNLKNIAQKTLDDFFSLIEENYEEFDVDFEEEVLKFEKDDQIYILSFHEPTSQIWLSSPISGAHHFELKDKNNSKSWFSTRDLKLNLYDLILNEINK
ncbi:MAG: hypothetical protein CMM99_02670 [Rickettsiales bacterium]|nr:hypothetical protein [Rickettsiales bacterium]